MLDRERLTSHIKKPELLLKMRMLIDKAEIALNKHVVVDTDFIDPFERKTAMAIFNGIHNLGYLEAGGPEFAERKYFLLFPDYMVQMDFIEYTSYLEISGDINSLNHRDFLGSLMSMGIKRGKIGDIFIGEKSAIVSLKKEIGDYLLMNIQKVGNVNVKCSLISIDKVVFKEQAYERKDLFIASERLDVMTGAAFNLSRNESQAKIEAGDIKVNWESVEKSSYKLEPGDMISARGLGRALYETRNGLSKKGRLNIALKIYK
ncbi:MAG TPA: RNA-binding protein [Tissierellales bacterium]|nr:RNA-binding protein [Tissierellales bacterium]